MKQRLFDNTDQDIILIGCLYIICTRLDYQGRDYFINTSRSVAHEYNQPWVNSLHEMSYYSNFGPLFSTLVIHISHYLWDKYENLLPTEKALAAKIVMSIQNDPPFIVF